MSPIITDEIRKKAVEARNDPEKICGAPTKRGGVCKFWAGYRTNHPGTGFCWLHDQPQLPSEVIDGKEAESIVLATAEQDTMLDLSPEIQALRQELELLRAGGEMDMRVISLVSDTLRKLVQTKHQIELQRRYLIPATTAIAAIRRVMDIIGRYLTAEQRLAIRDEVAKALKEELGQ